MNVKKLAIIGVIALVVVGCVLAAGCTSNTTTQQTTSDDKIVGNWTFPYDNGEGVTGIGIEVIKKDGTGFNIVTTEDGKRIQRYTPCTWKKNADSTYTFTFTNVNNVVKMTYDVATDTYVDKEYHNVIHKRLDPITGIWFVDGSDEIGKSKLTVVTKNDGTGYQVATYSDGTTRLSDLTWTKNADGTYSFIFSHYPSQTRTWTLNAAKDTITTSFGNIYQKKFADSSYYLSYLGPWYNPETRSMFTINGDGTGSLKSGDGILNFTWTIPEFGKFKLTYLDGDYKGKESIWTYDREKDVFNTATNYTLVHPNTSIDGLTITKFTTEPIVGIWFCENNTDNGKETDIMLADGTGHWFISSPDGTVSVGECTWTKNDEDTYLIKWSDDEIVSKWMLNSAKDTITSSTGSIFMKKTNKEVQNILGPWYNKDNEIVMIFNADGTGIGKSKNGVISFTWKLNNSKICVTYTDGTANNGSSLKGKTFEWTYDRENNVFISQNGDKHIRPTETIKDRITFN